MATVFMLSGQGSQYYQMGRDLFSQDALFNQHLTALNSMVYDLVGQSVLDVIYCPAKNISDPLDEALISGLSISVIELALIKTLNNKGIYADILLGSSFGTLVAAIVANCMSEEEGIHYLANHGSIFKETCDEGNMITVLASPQHYYESLSLHTMADLAGIYFDSSFVISLPDQHLNDVELTLKKLDLSYQKMPVSRAYHSRWIESAKDKILELYGQLGSRMPKIPLYCASHIQSLEEINAHVFWNVVRGPIQFQETIRWMEHTGPHQYIDVGPSGTLATILKYALAPNSQSQPFPVLSPFKQSVKNLNQLLSRLKISG